LISLLPRSQSAWIVLTRLPLRLTGNGTRGVALEDVLDFRGEAELGAFVLELDDDLAAPPLPFGFLDRVFAGAVGFPDVAGLGGPP